MNPLRCGPDGCVALDARVLVRARRACRRDRGSAHDRRAAPARQPRAPPVPLLGLMYASACGGPYGTEDFVAKVGPGLFMLLLFVTPWIWGMPTAFATAELSTRRPVAGGYYRWASEYLGPFWGYQEGVWNLLMSFLDNALYPVLFARAVSHLLGGVSPLAEWGLATGFILVLTYLNYRGIQIAGDRGPRLERVPDPAPRLAGGGRVLACPLRSLRALPGRGRGRAGPSSGPAWPSPCGSTPATTR